MKLRQTWTKWLKWTLGCGALLGPAGLGTAGAANLDFGVAYGGPGTTFQERAWGRLGISDLGLLGGRVSAGVSTRAAELGYARGLSLAPLGSVSTRTDLAVTWSGGVRLGSRATASVGPVALNLGGSYFTAPATAVDPLAAWTFAPTDLRAQGWNADLTARYRVSRTLVAVVGGEFGSQTHAVLGVEGRRDLTRTGPTPEPQAEPADGEAAPEDAGEPEVETLGTLSWRLGARAGRDVLGVTGGLTYATEAGLSLGLDALVGPGGYGVTGSLGAPDLLGEGSTVRLYAAYEPWRTASAPLRAGVEATVPLGPGEVGLGVSGGRSLAGVTGYGARVTYRLPLGSREP